MRDASIESEVSATEHLSTLNSRNSQLTPLSTIPPVFALAPAWWRFYFSDMKRLSLFCLLVLACLPGASFAQNNAAADALERKNIEERFGAIYSRIEGIEQAQESLRRKYDAIERQLQLLAREIQETREKSMLSGAKFATRDDLEKYVKDLQEIDRKREADKALILKSFNELSKIPMAPPHVDSKPPADPAETPGDYYTVKETGETLLDIIKAFNTKFKDEGRSPINLEMVKKANPGLNPDRIRPKQKIRIPIPPKKK